MAEDATVCHLWNGLASKCPAFPVDASKLTFFSEPSEFFTSLTQLVLRSKTTIVIAALYLGTDEQCAALVSSLQQALQSSKALRVCLLFDRMRATRRVTTNPNTTATATTVASQSPLDRHDSTSDLSPTNLPVTTLSSEDFGSLQCMLEGESNSLRILAPLLHPQYGNRVTISLYQTPLLTSWFRTFVRSPRTQEIAGVQHLKVFIGDDDLILSGANLEKNYFTERQDRYVYFRQCKDLVSWYTRLVEAVCSFSYTAVLPPTTTTTTITSSSTLESVLVSPPPCGFDPLTSPTRFNQFAYEKLHPLLAARSSLTQRLPASTENPASSLPLSDTWVFPTIQMGSAGVVHDEEVTTFILKECSNSHDDRLFLSSPYFNITDCYTAPLLSSHSQSSVDVITAHPTANGFFTAKDVSRYIPSLYLIASHWFMDKVMHQGHHPRVSLHEYRRPHWTYHAKGLWWDHQNPSLASLTMIGSPNFGYRSIHRDLESQVVILTQNAALRSTLSAERSHLLRYAERVVDPRSRFQQPDLTNIPLWVKVFAPLAQRWL